MIKEKADEIAQKKLLELENKFEKAAEALSKSSRILLVSPENPDIDSISCLCAFQEFLRWFNPTAEIWLYCYDFLISLRKNALFRFLKGSANVQTSLPSWIPDRIIIFDYGNIERARLPQQYHDIFTIGFDHHSQVGPAPNIILVDEKASSCTIMLYRFFRSCGFPILGTSAARALLTGIIADTGRFSNPGVNIKALEITAQLDPKDIWFSKMLCASRRKTPLKRWRLWEEMMASSRMNFDETSGLIFYAASLKKIKELKATRRDFLTFFNLMQDVAEAKVAAIILQNENGSWSVSLRPSPTLKINCEKIAKDFGGGGHPYAAGFTWQGDIDILLASLKNAILLFR